VTATEQQRSRCRHRPNSAFDVMALAASAGGLKAWSHILTGLPTDFPASVLVQHHCQKQHSAASETWKIDLVPPLYGRAFALRILAGALGGW
jgi:chemotaxis response regulator CheB